MSEAASPQSHYEYIVVGSGAGGGTVAARLAEAGRSVLLLEAGGDPCELTDSRLPQDYQVPAFHAFASENPAIRWDFFVRHYADEPRQQKDRRASAITSTNRNRREFSTRAPVRSAVVRRTTP